MKKALPVENCYKYGSQFILVHPWVFVYLENSFKKKKKLIIVLKDFNDYYFGQKY